MRVAQLWGFPSALAGGLRVPTEVLWFVEMVQLIGVLRRGRRRSGCWCRGSALYSGGRRRFEFL